jgi:dienelactone hydrolase
MKRLLMTMLLASQLLVQVAFASDYEREKRWADEVAPGLLMGDAVYLKQQNQHEFLTLYTPVDGANSALIVVHGLGTHPDWGLIGTLRTELADKGYTTLSVQMPILSSEAKSEEYPATFPEAVERLELAVKFLKSKGYSNIAIVSHSMGSRMTYAYLTGNPAPEIKAWVSMGLSTSEDLSVVKVAMLDMYGEKDYPYVQSTAGKRKSGLAGKAKSRQQVIAGADHFYNDREKQMVEAVHAYLKGSLGK